MRPSFDRRSVRAGAQRERRREAILRAASTLFSRQGYHSTSVADVIAAAGISRGTFYLYFDNKDSLFLELMEQFIQRIMEVLEVVDPDGANPTLKIYENVRRVVDVVFDYQDLTVMVLREDLGPQPGGRREAQALLRLRARDGRGRARKRRAASA